MFSTIKVLFVTAVIVLVVIIIKWALNLRGKSFDTSGKPGSSGFIYYVLYF